MYSIKLLILLTARKLKMVIGLLLIVYLLGILFNFMEELFAKYYNLQI